jgi:hypothetical protein
LLQGLKPVEREGFAPGMKPGPPKEGCFSASCKVVPFQITGVSRRLRKPGPPIAEGAGMKASATLKKEEQRPPQKAAAT